ncbi:thiamine-phosphate kinase [Candidatus Acetothermia bacterium]|nr:thiamine-phosphate kinase [Candidatus Acetothermia bacterium]MBI3643795.1 thiamine-phosphate kinase [Candidatus Acetothermia bacterium]
MNEREVLKWLKMKVPYAGDDCAILPFRDTQLVLTTDMLFEPADFPKGTTPYTMGWRTVAVSLSDIAAMGSTPLGVVVALGAPEFEQEFLEEVLKGLQDCCNHVQAPYVGGDLSRHSVLTLVSSAVGESREPIKRSGAKHGDLVCVTGQLGRTAAALKLFANKKLDEANELFCFTPRINEGLSLAPFATSMMDISDGLARSLYQMSEAGGVGFQISHEKIPVTREVQSLSSTKMERDEMALYTGEDFELLFTISKTNLQAAQRIAAFRVIGEVIKDGIFLEEDGKITELNDRGYEH